MAAHHNAFSRFVRTGKARTDEQPKVEFNVSDEMLRHIVRKTGLSEETCAELLVKGWRYSREPNKSPTWIHPMESLLDTRFDFR